MGWLSLLLPSIAALLFYKMGHTILMALCIIVVIGCFWSRGVMHNYATEHAKLRSDYTGGFHDITKREAEAVPDWITTGNIIFSLMGLVLLITGIVFMIQK
jgi:hypothetical protein